MFCSSLVHVSVTVHSTETRSHDLGKVGGARDSGGGAKENPVRVKPEQCHLAREPNRLHSWASLESDF